MDLSLDGSRFLHTLAVHSGGLTGDSPGSTLHICACSALTGKVSTVGTRTLCGFGPRQRLPATGWPRSPGLGYFRFQSGHACMSQERIVFVGSY